jgi:hypothetical protein
MSERSELSKEHHAIVSGWRTEERGASMSRNALAVRSRRRRRVVAAVLLAATVSASGSAHAAAPVGPSTPGSTWTDPGTSTVTTGIPLPQHR